MARKFVTWTVGTEAGHSEGFDWEQTPESVLAELTRYLTDPRVLRDNTFFVRGVLALLLTEVDAGGRLDHDVAVLELDKTHAMRFVRLIKPRHTLLLNVMRDQLDRFSEINYTASESLFSQV